MYRKPRACLSAAAATFMRAMGDGSFCQVHYARGCSCCAGRYQALRDFCFSVPTLAFSSQEMVLCVCVYYAKRLYYFSSCRSMLEAIQSRLTLFGAAVSTPAAFMHSWGALELLFELHECKG